MESFNLKSLYATTHDSSYGGYKWKVCATIEIDAKYWAKCKKSKSLGSLYGVDIGNALYAYNNAIPAYNPMVDDTKNAKKGIKSISLVYHFNDINTAEKLGLTVNKTKAGEVWSKFGDHVDLMEKK